MAKGFALVLPELVETLKYVLPTGVTVGEISDYGGSKRVELHGKQIVKDKGYQIVVTRDQLGTYVELVENNFEEDRKLDG